MPASDYIWRLEGPDGKGPYNTAAWFTPEGAALKAAVRRRYYDPDDHPAPWDEGINAIDGVHVYGFDSLTAARRWWYDPTDAAVFARHGLHLVAYPWREVGDIQNGVTQLAFARGDSEPIRFPVARLWDTDDDTLGTFADGIRAHRDLGWAQHVPYDA